MSQDADALERAITLACWAHQGQRYPSPEAEPYIIHPLRVMLAVQGSRAQMAAVLHDVIEDTEVSPGRLREADLPEDVIAAVVVGGTSLSGQAIGPGKEDVPPVR